MFHTYIKNTNYQLRPLTFFFFILSFATRICSHLLFITYVLYYQPHLIVRIFISSVEYKD